MNEGTMHFSWLTGTSRDSKLGEAASKWRRWTRQSITQSQSQRPPPAWLEFVHGDRFQTFISLVIVANALFIGYGAHVELRSNAHGEPKQDWCAIVEGIFAAVFISELLLRALAERGWAFLCGAQRRWNLFDSALVGLQVLDMLASDDSSSAVSALSLGRLLRLARFFRLLRLTRVIKNTYSLRLVVFSILDSIMSLFWCFLVIASIIYVFSVMILYGMAEHFSRLDDATAVGNQDLLKWYGGLLTTMTTLFSAISGGADWFNLLEPLAEVSELFVPLFLFYIFFMYIGVLNVVVGAFVASTAALASKDRERMEKDEMARLEAYITNIKTFFSEADTDNSNTLSWSEFRTHLQNPKVKAYFQALELDLSQAHVLFNLLDVDGDNHVTLDEFLEGCLRLKGQARNLDVNLLIFSMRKAFNKSHMYQIETQKELRRISKLSQVSEISSRGE